VSYLALCTKENISMIIGLKNIGLYADLKFLLININLSTLITCITNNK